MLRSSSHQIFYVNFIHTCAVLRNRCRKMRLEFFNQHHKPRAHHTDSHSPHAFALEMHRVCRRRTFIIFTATTQTMFNPSKRKKNEIK